MLYREYWGFRQEWLDYVKSTWKGIGRVELVSDDSPERLAFIERVEVAAKALDIPVRMVKTYLSVQLPETGCGYAKGYPHIHHPLNALTMVHYLDPGDKPAPLDVFEDGEVVETIYPEQGMTVFIPNNVWHGVRINEGTMPRIQLIATALRKL